MDQNKFNSYGESQERRFVKEEYYRRAYITNSRKDKATAILAIVIMIIGGITSALLIKSGLEIKSKYEFSLCCETPNDQ